MTRYFWFVFFIALSPLQATLLVYEPFGYTVGANINGQNGGTGFSDVWKDDDTSAEADLIHSGSLTSGALQTSGNSLAMIAVEEGSSATRKLTTITGTTGTTTWINFLFCMTEPGSGDLSANGAYLTVGASAAVGVDFGVFADPNNLNQLTFGIRTFNENGSSTSFSNVLFQPFLTYSLVASIDWKNLTNPEEIRLFINPMQTATPNPASASASASMHVGLNSGTQRLNYLNLNAGEANTEWIFDEIRLGTTFTDVMPIPEPRMAFLTLSGLIILLGKRIFRLRLL